MTFTLILIVLSASALAAMYLAVRGYHRGLKRIEDLEGNTSPVDLQCFSSITDIKDKQFLRSTLPPNTFRRIQRQRILIAMGYVKNAASNAAILVRIGELQSAADSAEIRVRAKALVEESFRLRLSCLMALVMLAISFLFPDQDVSIVDLISHYERMSDSFGMLGSLSDPIFASRARSWL